MNSGIYTITNKTNGHRYVGSAVDLEKRFRDHRNHLRNQTHCNAYLQNAWNKYGEDAFLFEILEEWEPEFLISMEQWWMNMLCPEYNIAPIAGSQLGIKLGPFSEKHRAKISAALKGRKFSDEHRANLSAAFKGMQRSLGRKLSDKTKAKISATNVGRKLSKEHKAKISKGLMKLPHEQRMKNYENSLGKRTSEQHRKDYLKGCGRFPAEQLSKWGKLARKLIQSQVHEIRHLLALGDMTQKEIAEHYPVSERTINRINTGHAYADW